MFMDELTPEQVKQIQEEIHNEVSSHRGSRVVTQQQEIAYRLCHHDYHALSYKRAAQVMGLTPQRVGQLLTEMESAIRAAAPNQADELFPVLTPVQAKIYDGYCNGREIAETAEELEVVEETVSNTLTALLKRYPRLRRDTRPKVQGFSEAGSTRVIRRF